MEIYIKILDASHLSTVIWFSVWSGFSLYSGFSRTGFRIPWRISSPCFNAIFNSSYRKVEGCIVRFCFMRIQLGNALPGSWNHTVWAKDGNLWYVANSCLCYLFFFFLHSWATVWFYTDRKPAPVYFAARNICEI